MAIVNTYWRKWERNVVTVCLRDSQHETCIKRSLENHHIKIFQKYDIMVHSVPTSTRIHWILQSRRDCQWSRLLFENSKSRKLLSYPFQKVVTKQLKKIIIKKANHRSDLHCQQSLYTGQYCPRQSQSLILRYKRERKSMKIEKKWKRL